MARRAVLTWVTVVVGVHFVALARVSKEVSVTWLGWALTGCGVVGLVLAMIHRSSASIAVVAGTVPGAILLAGSFWGAGRMSNRHPTIPGSARIPPELPGD